MNLQIVAKYLGVVSFMLAISLLLSVPWAFPGIAQTPHIEWASLIGLAATMALSLAIGAALYYWGRNAPAHLYRRESLAIVGLSWCLASLLGALPFLLSGTARGVTLDAGGQTVVVPMTIADAVFESASGFTGCGATVITDLENPELVPRAILFWRSETHFLGALESWSSSSRSWARDPPAKRSCGPKSPAPMISQVMPECSMRPSPLPASTLG